MPRLLADDTFLRLCRAREFLAASFHQRVTLEQAASRACFSPYHFHRLFAQAFGETAHEFVSRLRLQDAKRRLAADHESITEVCFNIGYESLGSFSSRFHATVGLSPSKYRSEIRKVFGFSAPWRVVFVPSCFLHMFGVPQPQDSRSDRLSSGATLVSKETK